MATSLRREAFDFFHEHAGYVVGERAIGAASLARAEYLLEQATSLGVAGVRWVDDHEPYDPGDVARYFEDGTWTGPFGCIVSVYGEPNEAHGRQDLITGASLWGIVLGRGGTWWPPSPHTIANGDPYGRVVIAELASEIEDDLRQAIGDALDARQEVSYA